jgi:hypothetical protein
VPAPNWLADKSKFPLKSGEPQLLARAGSVC